MDIFGGAAEGYFQYEAAKEQSKIMKEQLEFQKQMYQDWYKVYGTLQEDIGTYFKNLTGEEISAKERQAIQKAAQEAQKELSQMMMQKGIEGSGLEASLMADIEWDAELKKAMSQATADERLIAQKMGFLGLGLGKDVQIANMMNNSAMNYGKAKANQYATLGNVFGTLGGYIDRRFNPVGGYGNYNTDNGWLF